jgi:hypothetical protein
MAMCGVTMPLRVERGLMHCRLLGQDTSARTVAGGYRQARAGLKQQVGTALGPLHLIDV